MVSVKILCQGLILGGVEEHFGAVGRDRDVMHSVERPSLTPSVDWGYIWHENILRGCCGEFG